MTTPFPFLDDIRAASSAVARATRSTKRLVDYVARARRSLSDLTPDERASLVRRFEAKVSPEPNTGCHLWTGSLNTDDYAQISVRNTRRKGVSRPVLALAHRVAWMLERGDIGPGLVLDHCVCGITSCVNPAHLEPVTPAENRRRQSRRRPAPTAEAA